MMSMKVYSEKWKGSLQTQKQKSKSSSNYAISYMIGMDVDIVV